jgi:hypothetical protein
MMRPWQSIYVRLRPQLPHLIAALTFGLAGGVVTTEGVQQSAEFLTVPGTALIGAAVSELARLVNNVAKEQSVEKHLLPRRLREELVRSIYRLRTLLEEIPEIPTYVRQMWLETLEEYQGLIGELGYLTPQQQDEMLYYLTRLEDEYRKEPKVVHAVSELTRLVDSVAKEQRVFYTLLPRRLREELVRSILKLRTLLEETPGIPTYVRQEQLESLEKYQELISELGYLTPQQQYEIVDYLMRLKEEYPEELERYAQAYGHR